MYEFLSILILFETKFYIDNIIENVLGSFIFVIILNMFRFKSSVLFGTHTLLDKPLTVFHLPTNLSNLTVNG